MFELTGKVAARGATVGSVLNVVGIKVDRVRCCGGKTCM
jgi:hypothetical protein